MEIKLSREMCRELGVKKLKSYGLDRYNSDWKPFETIDLADHPLAMVKKIQEELEPFAKQGIKVAITDLKTIDLWVQALTKGADTVKARTVEKFTDLLIHYLLGVPGHRIFKRDTKNEVNLCYYVGQVDFIPKKIHEKSTTPAHCDMAVFFREFGGQKGKTITFWPEDCVGRTPSEALLAKDIVIENAELRREYQMEEIWFHTEVDKVGKQFLAVGLGVDDLDGNDDDRHHSWWRRQSSDVRLDKNGEPANVVIDIFVESDEEDRDRDDHPQLTFWRNAANRKKYSLKDEDRLDEEDEKQLEDMPRDTEGNVIGPEIPMHPKLAMFALKKQMRLRVHVAQLTEYIYDTKLGDKLILPQENRDLVTTLVNYNAGFKDVVKGKGFGSIVLSAGPPGTGKTLTAEVFSEVSRRPLYTVHCSQLGTDPQDLEKALLKVFARAQRWNAILLLDEADVYVHRRGDNLAQNAIVGVFLRTLEYFNGVLFLTTNREDLVDDAIASRCVAKIPYKMPSTDDQKKIWKVLAESAGMVLTEDEINLIVREFGNLSGRDIKNLLKLVAMTHADTTNALVTLDRVTFIKRFKPTADIKD
jgi:hypothetical protein